MGRLAWGSGGTHPCFSEVGSWLLGGPEVVQENGLLCWARALEQHPLGGTKSRACRGMRGGVCGTRAAGLGEVVGQRPQRFSGLARGQLAVPARFSEGGP